VGSLLPSLKGTRIAGLLESGTLKSAWTRAQIQEGALAGLGLEMAYLQSGVDAFFVHVQGSCLLDLEDEGELRLSYDGVNGHAYTSLGKVLIQDYGQEEKTMSMQAIYAYFQAHPEQISSILARNHSYVFFQENHALQQGPRGAYGVELTARRALAVDPLVVPLGLPLWVEASDSPRGPLSHFTASLDVGGAIKGQRLDYYWGSGVEAGEAAGKTHHQARLFAWVPKDL